MKFPEQQNKAIRKWVYRVVHELIVQNREPIVPNMREKVLFT